MCNYFKKVVIIGTRFFMRYVDVKDSNIVPKLCSSNGIKILPGKYNCFVWGRDVNYIDNGVLCTALRVEGVGISNSFRDIVTELNCYEKIAYVRVKSNMLFFSEGLKSPYADNGTYYTQFFDEEKMKWITTIFLLSKDEYMVSVENGRYPLYALKTPYDVVDGPEIIALTVDLSDKSKK